jgi:hypothetical protein
MCPGDWIGDCLVVDLLVEDLEKWFPRSLTQHVRITIIQSAAHILNTYDAKISDCKPQSLSLSLSPHCGPALF